MRRTFQVQAGILGGALLAGLCGCSGFWETVTAKGFKPHDLWEKEDPLVVLRDSDSGDKRGKALRALQEPKQHGGTDKDQDVIMEILTRSATSDPVPLCRLSAIQTLGRFKDPRAVTVLSNSYYQATTFAPETATIIQVKSLEALGRTGNPDAVPLLATVVREPSPALDVPDQEKQQSRDRRAAAAAALGHFSHYQAAQALVFVLKNEKDVALRNKAHDSLVAATGKKLPADGQAWEDMFQQAAAKGDKPEDSKVKLTSWFQKYLLDRKRCIKGACGFAFPPGLLPAPGPCYTCRMAPDAAHRFLNIAPCADKSFHALTGPFRSWFRQRFGEPTRAQRLAWPAVAAGEHLLVCAPTGSGKTLAAFLPILDRLLFEPTGAIRCLYVAPLKALIADARRNLRLHLRSLRQSEPITWPPVRIATRTGDTSARRRKLLWLRPPAILLTTPESLALLLSQPMIGLLLAGVRWVVVDEVHALAGNKRGADLALSLERLAALTRQEPQRIGLSATCTPLSTAASFLAGAGRPCTIALVPDSAPLQVQVEPLADEALEEETTRRGAASFLARLVARLDPELSAADTLLIFTNTRGLAERLTWVLRRRLPQWADRIAVHHSAVAAERRKLVERRLKQGKLKAVVSSTSLELGFDGSKIDLVVLVHPPGGVVRLLQRVGRSGHAPGRPRRGLVLTSGPAELLEAAVTTASGHSGQCEPLLVPNQPLDVLCQQLVGMAAGRPWNSDEAFDLVRKAFPYRELSRADFDACLDYLTGRCRDGEPTLPARIRWEDGEFAIIDERTARLLRRNIGTIVAEETRSVKLDHSPAGSTPWAVGEVDDSFADRLKPGDRFLLDGRCLEFRRVEERALLVDETAGRPATPRWTGTGWPVSADLARRLYLLRARAAEALREGPQALAELLRLDCGLTGNAVRDLVDLFVRQECVSEIPDSATLLIEVIESAGATSYFLHTPLNRAGNDALARVIVERLARRLGRSAASLVADLGLQISVVGPDRMSADGWAELLMAAGFDDDLAAAVAGSLSLRERFRAVATTGLMLLRTSRRRVGGRDWAERRLFDQVRQLDPDFVLLRQARREVHEQVLDAAAARDHLASLPALTIHCRWLPSLSPLAEGWTQLGPGPAETIETPAEVLQRFHAELTTLR